jgi:hypothetical protein
MAASATPTKSSCWKDADMFTPKLARLASIISIGVALGLVNSPASATPVLVAPTVSLPAGLASPINVGEDNPSLEFKITVMNNDNNTVTLAGFSVKTGATTGDPNDKPTSVIVQDMPKGTCKAGGDIVSQGNCTLFIQFVLPNEVDDPKDKIGGTTSYTVDVVVSRPDFLSATGELEFDVHVHDAPEPSSLELALTGLIALGGIGLSRRKRMQLSPEALRTSSV